MYQQGWNNAWTENMFEVGETSEIVAFCGGSGISLKDGYEYPYFALEKIERKAEILNDSEKWIESAYTAKNIEAIADEIVPVTSTNDYDYYANLKWQMIYRVKKE
jgi:hypothetical protein